MSGDGRSAENDAGRARVNNWRVTWIKTFWVAKILCWHGNKNLRYLAASNGGEIYCDRCGMKRMGWIHDPDEPEPTYVTPPEVSDS